MDKELLQYHRGGFKMMIPIFLDANIMDATNLVIRFGNLKKKFENYNELKNWTKKANKLSPGWEK